MLGNERHGGNPSQIVIKIFYCRHCERLRVFETRNQCTQTDPVPQVLAGCCQASGSPQFTAPARASPSELVRRRSVDPARAAREEKHVCSGPYAKAAWPVTATVASSVSVTLSWDRKRFVREMSEPASDTAKLEGLEENGGRDAKARGVGGNDVKVHDVGANETKARDFGENDVRARAVGAHDSGVCKFRRSRSGSPGTFRVESRVYCIVEAMDSARARNGHCSDVGKSKHPPSETSDTAHPATDQPDPENVTRNIYYHDGGKQVSSPASDARSHHVRDGREQKDPQHLTPSSPTTFQKNAHSVSKTPHPTSDTRDSNIQHGKHREGSSSPTSPFPVMPERNSCSAGETPNPSRDSRDSNVYNARQSKVPPSRTPPSPETLERNKFLVSDKPGESGNKCFNSGRDCKEAQVSTPPSPIMWEGNEFSASDSSVSNTQDRHHDNEGRRRCPAAETSQCPAKSEPNASRDTEERERDKPHREKLACSRLPRPTRTGPTRREQSEEHHAREMASHVQAAQGQTLISPPTPAAIRRRRNESSGVGQMSKRDWESQDIYHRDREHYKRTVHRRSLSPVTGASTTYIVITPRRAREGTKHGTQAPGESQQPRRPSPKSERNESFVHETLDTHIEDKGRFGRSEHTRLPTQVSVKSGKNEGFITDTQIPSNDKRNRHHSVSRKNVGSHVPVPPASHPVGIRKEEKSVPGSAGVVNEGFVVDSASFGNEKNFVSDSAGSACRENVVPNCVEANDNVDFAGKTAGSPNDRHRRRHSEDKKDLRQTYAGHFKNGCPTHTAREADGLEDGRSGRGPNPWSDSSPTDVESRERPGKLTKSAASPFPPAHHLSLSEAPTSLFPSAPSLKRCPKPLTMSSDVCTISTRSAELDSRERFAEEKGRFSDYPRLKSGLPVPQGRWWGVGERTGQTVEAAEEKGATVRMKSGGGQRLPVPARRRTVIVTLRSRHPVRTEVSPLMSRYHSQHGTSSLRVEHGNTATATETAAAAACPDNGVSGSMPETYVTTARKKNRLPPWPPAPRHSATAMNSPQVLVTKSPSCVSNHENTTDTCSASILQTPPPSPPPSPPPPSLPSQQPSLPQSTTEMTTSVNDKRSVDSETRSKVSPGFSPLEQTGAVASKTRARSRRLPPWPPVPEDTVDKGAASEDDTGAPAYTVQLEPTGTSDQQENTCDKPQIEAFQSSTFPVNSTVSSEQQAMPGGKSEAGFRAASPPLPPPPSPCLSVSQHSQYPSTSEAIAAKEQDATVSLDPKLENCRCGYGEQPPGGSQWFPVHNWQQSDSLPVRPLVVDREQSANLSQLPPGLHNPVNDPSPSHPVLENWEHYAVVSGRPLAPVGAANTNLSLPQPKLQHYLNDRKLYPRLGNWEQSCGVPVMSPASNGVQNASFSLPPPLPSKYCVKEPNYVPSGLRSGEQSTGRPRAFSNGTESYKMFRPQTVNDPNYFRSHLGNWDMFTSSPAQFPVPREAQSAGFSTQSPCTTSEKGVSDPRYSRHRPRPFEVYGPSKSLLPPTSPASPQPPSLPLLTRPSPPPPSPPPAPEAAPSAVFLPSRLAADAVVVNTRDSGRDAVEGESVCSVCGVLCSQWAATSGSRRIVGAVSGHPPKQNLALRCSRSSTISTPTQEPSDEFRPHNASGLVAPASSRCPDDDHPAPFSAGERNRSYGLVGQARETWHPNPGFDGWPPAWEPVDPGPGFSQSWTASTEVVTVTEITRCDSFPSCSSLCSATTRTASRTAATTRRAMRQGGRRPPRYEFDLDNGSLHAHLPEFDEEWACACGRVYRTLGNCGEVDGSCYTTRTLLSSGYSVNPATAGDETVDIREIASDCSVSTVTSSGLSSLDNNYCPLLTISERFYVSETVSHLLGGTHNDRSGRQPAIVGEKLAVGQTLGSNQDDPSARQPVTAREGLPEGQEQCDWQSHPGKTAALRGPRCLKCIDGCPGLDLHYFRKVCKHCRCPQEDHDLPASEDADFRPISLLFDSTMTSPREGKGQVDWMARLEMLSIRDPGGLAQMCSPQNDVVISRLISENMRSQKYISMLPEDKQEFASQLRRRQLQRQLPLHDLDPRFCTSLGEKEAAKYDKFTEKRRKKAAGIGHVGEVSSPGTVKCHNCKATMESGAPGVIAERLPGECWHPGCFVCCTCRQLLVDNIYFCREGRVYCGRHYADQLYPRCTACDELIFAREYTQAEGRSWHVHHFCCWSCDTPLAGQRYIAKDDNPYCMGCFEKLYSKVCSTCQRPITSDHPGVTHNSFHWHACPHCFSCHACSRALMNQPFILRDGRLYCSNQCQYRVNGCSYTASITRQYTT